MNNLFIYLFAISSLVGSDSLPEKIKFSMINYQESSIPFNIPDTLRLIGLMADFQFENPDNPKTSGLGKFLDEDVNYYNVFYETSIDRCEKLLLDAPPHDQLYFSKQLNAAGSYYENISNGELPFTSHMILNSSSFSENGYYTVSEEMEYYAKGDSFLAELFSEVLNSAKFDIESFFQDKNYSPENVVFVVFHAGVGQEFSYPSLDPTIYDLKSAYIDEEMMGDIVPSVIDHDGISYEVDSGILLPETQNLIYYNVVEDIFGNPDYGTDDLCGVQIGLTGVFVLQIGYELGLPPMFNNDPNSNDYGSPGIGLFGLMDHGSNNGYGVIPAVPNPWTRIKAGWSNVNELNNNINLEMLSLAAYSQNKNSIYKVNISENEYFLIENRNNEIIPGYDIELLRYLLADDYLCDNCNLNCNGVDIDEVISNKTTINECIEENPFSNTRLNYFDILEIIQDQSSLMETQFDGSSFSNFINYDISLPGSGILIWHIVEPSESEYLIGVNNDRNDRSVQIEEADGALDIGFESYLFMSNSNTYGWKWDFWYDGNPAYNDANPGNEKTLFDKFSFPNTKTNNGSDSFLSIEILSDISESMNIKVIFDEGIDIFHFSDEPVRYLGNMVKDLKGFIFYEEGGDIFRQSFGGELIEMLDEGFNYIEGEGKFIFSYEGIPYYLENGSCLDDICSSFDNNLYSCGFLKNSSDTTCVSNAHSLGDIDGDGIDEIVTVENGEIIVKNYNNTLVNGFPVKGDFSGVPLIANILNVEDNLTEIICRENNHIVILSNAGIRMRQISSFAINQSLAIVPYWNDKMALIDGYRLLLFDQDLANSYWLNSQGRRSGLSATDEFSVHVPFVDNDIYYIQKAYNYPNPINAGKTTFRFFMKSTAGSVKIYIYDAAGFLIKDDLELLYTVGNEYNEIQWNGISLDSGLYLAEINREIGASELVRLVIIK